MSRAVSSADRWHRRSRIAQMLILFILLAGTVYVADTVVGGPLFHRGYRLTVELPEASGLHEGAVVNYRGQRIGEVRDVRLTGDDAPVVAEIEIESGVEIPRDSDVLVRHLSAVGEQYLDVRPRSAGGPTYADGDVMALADTGVPLGVPDVLAHAQSLMRSLDVADIRAISAVTEQVFADTDADLRAMSIELETGFALLRRLEPHLTELARDAEQPLRTGVELTPDVRAMLQDLALVAAAVNRATPDVRGIVVGASDLLPRLDRWWRRASPELRELLEQGLPVSEMAADHLRGLHHWLDWVPLQADVMAGSTRDGSGRVLLVPRILENCVYEPNRQRDLHELEPRAAMTDVRCADPPKGTQGRGSGSVPRQ